jgi:hypothetical protein
MKILRVMLIAMAAPAIFLLGLHEIGGTRLSKGYATGFAWRPIPDQGRLILSAQPDGNMDCRVELEIPKNAGTFTASIDGVARLSVRHESIDGKDDWLEIDKSATEDYFVWPSGRSLLVQDNPTGNLIISDWHVYTRDKAPDSKATARWRKVLFYFGLFLLLPAIVGTVLQGIESRRPKPANFMPQNCIEEMIAGFEGKDEQESEQARIFLRKLLIEDVSPAEALRPLKLNRTRQLALLTRIKEQFRFRLESHIEYLKRLSKRLS